MTVRTRSGSARHGGRRPRRGSWVRWSRPSSLGDAYLVAAVVGVVSGLLVFVLMRPTGTPAGTVGRPPRGAAHGPAGTPGDGTADGWADGPTAGVGSPGSGAPA